MSISDDLIISPTPLVSFPQQLIANWTRKVEIETAYITSVDTSDVGTEKRRGLKVRPRRFINARLTAMDYRDIARLKTFQLRTANQVVPYPIYSDITQATINGTVFFGNFVDTRFFVGGRLIHFNMDVNGVSEVASYVISAVADFFVIVTTSITTLGPGTDFVAPLIDADIELRPADESGHTDNKSTVDINVNEKMDESALVPTTTPSRGTVFFDDFSSEDTIDYGYVSEIWNTCTGSLAGYLPPEYIAAKACWLCVGGVKTRCVNTEVPSAETPTTPSFTLQCGDTPAETCEQLIGVIASDGYDGTECDTAAFEDVIWLLRYAEKGAQSGQDPVIESGRMKIPLSVVQSSDRSYYTINTASPLNSDFYYSAILSVENITPSGNPDVAGPTFWIEVVIGGTLHAIAWSATQDGWATLSGSWSTFENNASGGQKKLAIRRVGTTLTFEADDVVKRTVTASGTAIPGFIGSNGGGSGGGPVRVAADGFFDDQTLLDENGDDAIAYDPTGEVC